MKTGRMKVDDKKEFSEQKTQQCLFPVVSGRVALKCVPVDLRRPLFVLDASLRLKRRLTLNAFG